MHLSNLYGTNDRILDVAGSKLTCHATSGMNPRLSGPSEGRFRWANSRFTARLTMEEICSRSKSFLSLSHPLCLPSCSPSFPPSRRPFGLTASPHRLPVNSVRKHKGHPAACICSPRLACPTDSPRSRATRHGQGFGHSSKLYQIFQPSLRAVLGRLTHE